MAGSYEGGITSGSLPPVLINQILTGVRETSVVAQIGRRISTPIRGTSMVTLFPDSEAEVVAEGAAKADSGDSVGIFKIVPVKVEYGMRVSDEIMLASEQEQVDMLQGFAESYQSRLARALDAYAFAGINPRSKTNIASGLAAYARPVVVDGTSAIPATNIEEAISTIAGFVKPGVGAFVSTPTFNTLMSGYRAASTQGALLYPEFGWAGAPERVNGRPFYTSDWLDGANYRQDLGFSGAAGYVTTEYGANDTGYTTGMEETYLIGGDFSRLMWGIAASLPVEVIRYGDPDNSGNDLRGYNQVYIRAETFIAAGYAYKKYNATDVASLPAGNWPLGAISVSII